MEKGEIKLGCVDQRSEVSKVAGSKCCGAYQALKGTWFGINTHA